MEGPRYRNIGRYNCAGKSTMKPLGKNPSQLRNVYEFDNIRLVCSLQSDSPLMNDFVSTSNMIGKTVSNVGFIMCIPEINNLDTLRYIRKG
jgi:hypothetical protein